MKPKFLDSTEKCLLLGSVCLISLIVNGFSGVFGLLFVSSLSVFGASRKLTSIPYMLPFTVRNLLSPLIGYFGSKFGLRAVTGFGGVVAAISLIGAVFANRIEYLIVFIGLGFGLGYGMSCVLLPQALYYRFEEHIDKANGWFLGSGCVGVFVLAPLTDFLLNTYTLPGTLLILGGLLLHVIPAALLLRKPARRKQLIFTVNIEEGMSVPLNHDCAQSTSDNRYVKVRSISEVVENNSRELWKNDCVAESYTNEAGNIISADTRISDNILDEVEEDMLPSSSDDNDCFLENSSSRRCVHNSLVAHNSKLYTLYFGSDDFDEDFQHANSKYDSDLVINTNESKLINSSDTHETDIDILKVPREIEQRETRRCDCPDDKLRGIISNNLSSGAHKSDLDCISKEPYKNGDSEWTPTHYSKNGPYSEVELDVKEVDDDIPSETSNIDEVVDCSAKRSLKQPPSRLFRVFLDPVFILMNLTQGLILFSFVCLWTVIVDVSMDKGLSRREGLLVLLALNVASTLGNFFLGTITDSEYISKTSFATICYLATGVGWILFVYLHAFLVIIIDIFLTGLFIGGIYMIGVGILSCYIEEEFLRMATASRYFSYAPISIFQPYVIGYFRDSLKSYDGLFYTMAAVSFICALITFFIPSVARVRDKRKEICNASLKQELL